MSFQCAVTPEPFVSDAFAIVGYYYKLTPREHDARLGPSVELVEPEVLFQYPPPPPADEPDVEEGYINQSIASLIKMEFCRPDGYRARDTPELPAFHSITLTKMPEGRRTHASVLTFYEAHKVERSVSFNAQIYVPKFLIFLSRLNMADFFKQCLESFYHYFFMGSVSDEYLNKAIAMLVRNVRVPMPGQYRQLDFGIGQPLVVQAQAPMCLPRTGLGVYRLFHLLGVNFVVDTVRCLLNEAKIVVYAKDLSIVTDSCQALMALLWPFPYNYVYAPAVGRRVLDDLLEAPTVFCIGTCQMPEDNTVFDRNGIVLVDLEARMVIVPQSVSRECVNFSEIHLQQLFADMTMVLSSKEFFDDWTSVVADDSLCSNGNSRGRRIEMRLRACFLRLYSAMFANYRRSISTVRFYPVPRVYFDVAHFLGERGLKLNDTKILTVKLVKSFFDQLFAVRLFSIKFQLSTFALQERYHPYRVVDVFDEICAKIEPCSVEEITDRLLASDICSTDAVDEPWKNGVTNFHSPSAIAQAQFRRPNNMKIADMLTDNRNELDNANVVVAVDMALGLQHRVPVCSNENADSQNQIVSFLCRALDRLFIDNGEDSPPISTHDQRLLDSVVLDAPAIRRQFCFELSRRSLSNNGRLNEKNFDYLTKLVSKLVEGESQEDENGIVCALLEAISNISHRPSPQVKPVYLHQRLAPLEVWWSENFWLSWLGRFIAAELAGYYSEQTPQIQKEPGYSMEVLTDLLSVMPSPASRKQEEEERRIVEGCRLCIDLMLPLLLDHPSYSATPPKEKKSFFKKIVKPKNPASPPSNSNTHRQRVCCLISSVIKSFAGAVHLPDVSRNDLLRSIKEKINHQE